MHHNTVDDPPLPSVRLSIGVDAANKDGRGRPPQTGAMGLQVEAIRSLRHFGIRRNHEAPAIWVTDEPAVANIVFVATGWQHSYRQDDAQSSDDDGWSPRPA